MPSPGRTPAGSPARRARAERILDAAAELVRQHGYRRVSIDDVAAAAGVGKGTIYLHWKTREALFWAALQRETMRLLDDLADRLSRDATLALPHRLMPAIFLEVQRRPLVRAVLLSDGEVLGALAADDSVAAAQRELAGNADYLELLARHGLLRAGLTRRRPVTSSAASCAGSSPPRTRTARPARTRRCPRTSARTCSPMCWRGRWRPASPAPADATAAVSAEVIGLFRGITAVQRAQLERAY